ncbi:hypothetical protein ACFY1A_01860 [Streptomyces sp. NPDC001520]|uniref:hypothetical protein n=1 Tax=Streptomyces sp. NPDC001520 TaxID=3364581 RepID=UPI0036996EAC
MARAWEAAASALFERRLGKSAEELGNSDGNDECPDIWQLDNGDETVIGRSSSRGNMLSAAKKDIPDA